MTTRSASPASARRLEESAARGDRPRSEGVTRSRIVGLLSGELRVLPVLAMLGVIWLIFASLNDVFLTNRNISNLFLQIVVTGVIALGLIFVLLVGEIDLSVATNSGVSATLLAVLAVEHHWPTWPSLLIAVAFGALVGGVQASVITTFGVPSFLVTLGSGLALSGVLLLLLPSAAAQINLFGTPIADIAGTFLPTWLGWAFAVGVVVVYGGARVYDHLVKRRRGFADRGMLAVLVPVAAVAACVWALTAVLDTYNGVPVPVAVFFGLLALLGYVATQTRFGLYLYAVGGNAEAARRAGIPVGRIKVAAFMLAGGLAAVGGIIAASRILGVSASSGGGTGGGTVLLEAIAAAVIGGTSLFGGRGNVWAALFGALVIGSISNGMDLLGVSTEVKYICEGLILVFAVTVDAAVSRGRLLVREGGA